MRTLLLSISLSFLSASFSQTYSDDVAQLIFDNCASCHNPNGIAPFSLMNYQEVTAQSAGIYDAVFQDRMPPWPPNDEYKPMAHSRALEPAEKSTLLNWLQNGMPQGNPANTPAPPVFPADALLGPGDLEVQIPTYMSKAMPGSDDYVCFSMPSGLLQGKNIKAMEVLPGNREIVHHCLIYVDENATYPTDTTSGQCNGPANAVLVGGYTPGSSPLIFPNSPALKLGMNIPAGSNIVFAMHYPEGSYGQFDSTKVIFHFYDDQETGIRTVNAAPILQNWSFQLPPNQVTPVSASYGNIPIDLSLLSVFPHMHLLGEEIRSYALTPTNDTVRLIDIPRWDFHWQDFYQFKNLVKIPSNSVFHANGVYDNTVNNVHNPNNPPITVYPGLNTTDEMFLVYFHYLIYVPGDENHDLEQMTSLSLDELLVKEENVPLSVYPNPMMESLNIDITGESGENSVSVSIYDLNGKHIRSLANGLEFQSSLSLNWDGQSKTGYTVPTGVYHVSIRLNGKVYHQKIVKR
ncbi:MAG: T9SS type A sorting domain-containing protein [Brumimicrobium sp.]|nr:T9SS type A sorting domain-containing protein [Brumimicrobium sp.]